MVRLSAPSGILVVDKPAGISSAKIVAIVKNRLQAKKVGHAGTLDPSATGVLVCCVNKATKLARFMMEGTKTYRVTMCLGVATDTQDATGNVTDVGDVAHISNSQIQAAIQRFSGRIWQTPPVYSALKHKGRPLYRYARQGQPVQKPARPIDIEAIKILAIEPPTVHFEVVCTAGTYIRTLCADIGQELKCGGHMVLLRRIASSGFGIQEAVRMTEIETDSDHDRLKDRLIDMASALKNMPAVTVNQQKAQRIAHGNLLAIEELDLQVPLTRNAFLKVVDKHNNLLAVLSTDDERSYYRYECVLASETVAAG